MVELLDVLDGAGFRIGQVLGRQEVHRLGKVHRAMHLFIFNRNREVLLQRRSQAVDHFPGLLSISVTGHVAAGESSSQTVQREVKEELALDASLWDVRFLFSFFQEAYLANEYIDRHLTDVFVATQDISLSNLTLDHDEVTEVEFVPFADFQAMVESGKGGLAPVYGNECRDLIYFLRWTDPHL